MINKVLSKIPAEIDLGDNLYLDGLLYSNIVSMNSDEMTIPLKTMLRSDDFPAYSTLHTCYSNMYSLVTSQQFDL